MWLGGWVGLGPGPGILTYMDPPGCGMLTYMGPLGLGILGFSLMWVPLGRDPHLYGSPWVGILTYMGPPGPGILTYMGPPWGILTYMIQHSGNQAPSPLPPRVGPPEVPSDSSSS